MDDRNSAHATLAFGSIMWFMAGLIGFAGAYFLAPLVDPLLDLATGTARQQLSSIVGLTGTMFYLALLSFNSSIDILNRDKDLESAALYFSGGQRYYATAGAFIGVGLLAAILESDRQAIIDVMPAATAVIFAFLAVVALRINAHKQNDFLRWLSHMALASIGYLSTIATLVLVGS